MNNRIKIEPSVCNFMAEQRENCISQSQFYGLMEGHSALVSGVPMFRDNPEIYYNHSQYQAGALILPRALRIVTIPREGHNHLEDRFIGRYLQLEGYDEINDINYVFGVRQQLRFSIQLFDRG